MSMRLHHDARNLITRGQLSCTLRSLDEESHPMRSFHQSAVTGPRRTQRNVTQPTVPCSAGGPAAFRSTNRVSTDVIKCKFSDSRFNAKRNIEKYQNIQLRPRIRSFRSNDRKSITLDPVNGQFSV